jgi:hypothetical protein
MFFIFGPRTVTFDVASHQQVASVTFTGVDFAVAGGMTKLGGPFSLGVQLRNSTPNDVFMGLSYKRDMLLVTIADRPQIGSVPPADVLNNIPTEVVISGASVPPLGRIEGVITEITITLYMLTDAAIGNNTVDVWIRIDEALPAIAPLERIGAATSVEHSSVFQGLFEPQTFTAVANSADQLLLSFTSNVVGFQLRIISAIIFCYPTPFPGDLRVYWRVENGGTISTMICMLMSEMESMATGFYSFNDLYLPYGYAASLYATNVNSTKNFLAGGNVLLERSLR